MQDYVKKLVVISLLSSAVWAQQPFSLHLFATGMSMEYKEYGTDGTLLDSEEATLGDIGGVDVGAGYTYSHENGFYSVFEFDYQKVSGSTTYKGSRLGSGDPYGSVISTTQNRLKDLRFMFKELYALNSFVTLKAGVGYGHHSWERELSVIQLETYSWDYLRVVAGGAFRFDSASKLSFDVFAAYEYAFLPIMSTDINGVDADFELGGVQCYEIDLYAMYDLGRGFYLVGGFILKQQDITESNVVTTGLGSYYEPQSKDNQQFYKLGITYRF